MSRQSAPKALTKPCRGFPIFYSSKELYIILQIEKKNIGVIPPKWPLLLKVSGILKFPNTVYLMISLSTTSCKIVETLSVKK